jgi:acyl-CoA thioesterase
MAKESQPPMGFQLHVGFEMTERGEGFSRCELEVEEKHLNPHRVAHGGVMYTLADTAGWALPCTASWSRTNCARQLS